MEFKVILKWLITCRTTRQLYLFGGYSQFFENHTFKLLNFKIKMELKKIYLNAENKFLYHLLPYNHHGIQLVFKMIPCTLCPTKIHRPEIF